MGKFDEEHLRRFVAARERGDAAEMRRSWEELVISFFDRMDGFVGGAHKGRLDDEEHELVVDLAMTRFAQRMITSFRGESVGELVNACKTMASNICKDVQRKSIRDGRLDGPSLDDGWNVSDDGRRAPSWEAAESLRRHEREERGGDIAAFITWALPQVKDKHRRVLELTFHGAEIPEIMDELGISQDNAYARRSRGLKELKELKEQYDA